VLHGGVIEVSEMRVLEWKAVFAALNPSPVFEAVAIFAAEFAMNGHKLDPNKFADNKRHDYVAQQKQPALTADEQTLNDLWEDHLRTEFDAHSADEAVATMVANPLVKQTNERFSEKKTRYRPNQNL
jgi:hypothetical protein